MSHLPGSGGAVCCLFVCVFICLLVRIFIKKLDVYKICGENNVVIPTCKKYEIGEGEKNHKGLSECIKYTT